MNQTKSISRKEGFALLVTLVVVSVVLAIGLSLLFVTTRQYLLAVTANESEKAFQSAQIGLECLRYHRAQPDTLAKFLRDDTSDPTPSLECAGVVSDVVNSSGDPEIIDGGNYWLYNYRYSFEFNDDQCTEPSIYVADFREYGGPDVNLPVSGEGLETIRCTAGNICTAIFARGYNRPCDDLDAIYSIQREVTIQY
jgi:type II secretory pathway pseudopilin PulG